MMTPTRILRFIGIAGLVGWLGMVGWVAKITWAQNRGHAEPPLPPPPVASKALANEPAPPPIGPDQGPAPAPAPSADSAVPKPGDPAPSPMVERGAATSLQEEAPELAAAFLSAPPGDQPALSEDPEQSSQSFVERNQKEAEEHLKALTAEAELLRARLAKLESGIKNWRSLVHALKTAQGQATTSTALAPGAEEAGDLEPMKPGQPTRAREVRRVKWATAAPAAAPETGPGQLAFWGFAIRPTGP
ncbi:MAG: hypothetical protein ACLP7Q_08565 [Isosphaeraceae bacterium]